VWQINELVEHLLQRSEIAAVCGGAGGDIPRRVHAHPVDVMPGVVRELGEERSLSAAVAFPEWVQGVNVGEEFCQPGDERVAGKARSWSAASSRPKMPAA
jgi:hypothetical protein